MTLWAPRDCTRSSKVCNSLSGDKQEPFMLAGGDQNGRRTLKKKNRQPRASNLGHPEPYALWDLGLPSEKGTYFSRVALGVQ